MRLPTQIQAPIKKMVTVGVDLKINLVLYSEYSTLFFDEINYRKRSYD